MAYCTAMHFIFMNTQAVLQACINFLKCFIHKKLLDVLSVFLGLVWFARFFFSCVQPGFYLGESDEYNCQVKLGSCSISPRITALMNNACLNWIFRFHFELGYALRR